MDEPDLLGELAAYFLIPLPEPLGIPEGFPLRREQVEDFGEFISSSGTEESGLDLGPRVEGYVSMVAHHVQAGSADAYGMWDLLQLADRVLPWARPEQSLRVRLSKRFKRHWWGLAPSLAGAPKQDLTVMEVLVLVASDTESALSDAFDHAVSYIRAVQQAYHMVRRHPITLVSRESLPFAVPYAVGRLKLGPPEPVSSLSLFLLNTNLWAFTREPDLTLSQMQEVSTGLEQIQLRRPFLTSIECRREASVALSRRGDFRSAAILAATSAESMFDDLLLHLMWEEGKTPEAAAEVFADPRRGLVARVKSDYAQRVGGLWDVNRQGAIQDWLTHVSNLRHRAVHGGYMPSREEADRALECLTSLGVHLADCLSVARSLGRYPRTALSMLPETELRRRAVWGRVEPIANDPDEPDWGELFARWRATVEQLRLEVDGPRKPPSADRAVLLAVILPDGGVQWVLHDRAARMAAATERPSDPRLTNGLASVDRIAQEYAAERQPGALSAACDTSGVRLVPVSEWLPEYHFVPEASVMLDRTDPGLHWRRADPN